MAKPSMTSFRKEDYGDMPDIFREKFIGQLNDVVKSFQEILNANTLLGDNVKIIEKELILTNTEMPYRVKIDRKPVVVLIDQVTQNGDSGSHTTVAGVGGRDYTYEGGHVVFWSIEGLGSEPTKVRVIIL